MHSLLCLSAFAEGQQSPSAQAEAHEYLRTAALDKDLQLKILHNTMIAGIVLAHHAALATGNTARFDDVSVPLINPWVPRACDFEHRTKEPQT